jgi:hypothetical protein
MLFEPRMARKTGIFVGLVGFVVAGTSAFSALRVSAGEIALRGTEGMMGIRPSKSPN